MFVKSQDGAVVLNNDKVTEYSTDNKYDGRYKVAALVGENRVVIGRYSTKEKCRMAISMLICIGDEEEIFFSCREAERLYNLPPNSVGKVCRGELESIYGYRFGYL